MFVILSILVLIAFDEHHFGAYHVGQEQGP